MRKNHMFYALIASVLVLNIKYFPPYLYISIALISSVVVLYGLIWNKRNKKPLAPALISFSFVGFSASALKAIEVYFPQYQGYSVILGWIMAVSFISGFSSLAIIAFRYGDRKARIYMIVAITTLAIFAFLYWFTTR